MDSLLQAGGVLVELFMALQADLTERAGDHGPVDPGLAEHWLRMLTSLASARNAMRGQGLLRVVRDELALIDRHRERSRGRVVQRLTAVQARWCEFGSWVADNDGDGETSGRLLDQAARIASDQEDATLLAYISMRRSQRAAESHDAELARVLADPVVQNHGLPPAVRALAAIRSAQANALDRNVAGTARSLAAAYRLLDAVDSDLFGDHCTASYVRAYEAACRLALGEPAAAAAGLDLVLLDWPSENRLDEGLFRAHLAVAHADAGEVETAGIEAMHALALAIQTGSVRTKAILGRLVSLPDGSQVASVRQFREAWRSTVRGGAKLLP